MKRNLLITIAVAAIMVASTVAQAADVSFSGQFRPRFEIDNDFAENTSPRTYWTTRVRFNANTKVNDKTAVFLQFQSAGIWGSANTLGGNAAYGTGTRQSVGGGGNHASDNLSDVGFHQAYITLKKFAGQAVDMKLGRQEVVIDGHRLFGHTGWLQGAETKDAIRLFHTAANHALDYTYIMGDENDAVGNMNSQDYDVHVLHATTQGVMGGALSGILTLTNNDNGSIGQGDDEQWFTIGARQKGKVSGLDYRVEFYHQFGDAGVIANTCACGITGAVSADGADEVDRDAQMFGMRLGKTFKNATMSPTITLWFDMLTGMDDDDAAASDWGQFDTMYDTGHKFYGFQDFYLNRAGAGTGYYGLEDYALKTKWKVKPGYTFKFDYHHFRTQTDISDNDADTIIAADATLPADASMDEDLGSEVDLTLVHKYDANTKIVLGYSHYFSTTTFATINQGTSNANDGSDWAYLQIDTKF